MDQLGLSALYDILKWLVGALGAILFVFLIGLPPVWWRRRKLFRFLGLTRERPRFLVYLSTVFVTSGGSLDFRGTARTFSGPAVPAGELATIEPVARLFSDSALEELPKRLRGWFARKVSWIFQDVSPEFLASPQAPSGVQQGNLLTVGSRYYNSAGDVFAQSGRMMLSMEQQQQQMVIRVTRGSDVNRVFQQRAGNAEDLAILERFSDPGTGSTVFVAAGLGVTGTRGAVEYLAVRWRELYARFGADPFALCLRFNNVLNDPNAHRRAEELGVYAGT
jgi:hypothetical protein